MARTVTVGDCRVVLHNLAGWTKTEAANDAASAAFQTDQHKSGVVIHATLGTHATLIADMRAASAIMPWQKVINVGYVDFGAHRAYRVTTLLNDFILQAHYYFERPDGNLLAFVFTFAGGEEKRADRFDRFFEGLAVTQAPQNLF